jgi:16S rRNA (uracil1498-N3)-methyltransferase
MYRHFTTTENLMTDTCAIGREEARHLQTVLRVKVDDRVQLFDGQGRTREVVVSAVGKQGLALTAVAPVVEHPRAGCRLTLFACVSKGKRMDWTVEKAVELGVSEIVPVVSDRTIVRVGAEDGDAKADRWMRVAEEAARQCGTAWLPYVHPPMTFDDSLARVREMPPVFVAALSPEARPLREAVAMCPAPKQVGWFVGPEGDFTADEMDALLRAGAIPVSLGCNVLRTETACIYGLCVLNCCYC